MLASPPSGDSPAVLLAVNYSPQAEKLLAQGDIEFDLFKCPPWPKLIAAAQRWRPITVHFDFQAGQGEPSHEMLETAAGWFAQTSTCWVNSHFAPLVQNPPSTPLEGADPARAIARRQTLADLKVLSERFGADRVVLENVPWERRADYPIDRVAADPLLLAEVIRQSGCNLLLDLAHSRLAAEELGLSADQHLTAHPTERLAELHVTGLGNDSASRRRDHMPMDPEGWRLLDLALGEIAAGRWRRPSTVALEYGGVGPLFEWRSKSEVLRRDLRRLADLLQHHGLRQRNSAAGPAQPNALPGPR